MSNKIILASDDVDFFEYIIQKLKIRKSDEIYRFNYESLIKNYQLIDSSLVILNSEVLNGDIYEILKLLENNPCIVFALNDNDEIKNKFLKKGAVDFITPFNTDEDIQIKVNKALKIVSLLDKNKYYRKFLENNNFISKYNEVYIDYKLILEMELERINESSIPSVLVAISPNEKSKFLLSSNQIELAILSCIRKDDILMTYAANKYFLLLYNTNVEAAKNIWKKIVSKVPEKIYAGFASVLYKKREHLINEVLNRLHEAINNEKSLETNKDFSDSFASINFKNYKQEYEKNLEKIIIPVFYQIQQKYNNKLWGINVLQEVENGVYRLLLKSKYRNGELKITSPGFSKVLIDVNYSNKSNSQRISIESDEFEAGFLEDVIEQFISDFKREAEDGNT